MCIAYQTLLTADGFPIKYILQSKLYFNEID